MTASASVLARNVLLFALLAFAVVDAHLHPRWLSRFKLGVLWAGAFLIVLLSIDAMRAGYPVDVALLAGSLALLLRVIDRRMHQRAIMLAVLQHFKEKL